MTPQHDFSTSPLQLFWMDAAAFQKVAGVDKTVLLTQIAPTNQVQQESFPVKPPLSTIGDFKTMPAIHAGYAVTWFGLSAAGLYMTRKLVTKGRG
jgi:surfeit locus 1 family protein